MTYGFAYGIFDEFYILLKDSRGGVGWDYIFYIMILLLTVIREIEIFLHNVVAYINARDDWTRSYDNIVTEIKSVETKLADIFIDLFDKKYNINLL
jgi:hypothetical protein